MILLLAGNPFMRSDVPAQLKHPMWHGLRFADLFFPLFLFVVGVAMTLSRRSGSPREVLRRAALLLALGIALSSLKHGELYLPGVLQHIAGSYLLAWLILQAPRRIHALLGAGVLAGVWVGYLVWADPGADPWSIDDSFAHGVNGWILGGFATEGVLQTVTSSITVLGGALLGRGIRKLSDPRALFRWVSINAAGLIAAGLLLALVIPINKRLWTPSFTVLTLGTSAAMFALFIWAADVRGWRTWVRPLVELGANPIAIYAGFIAVRAVIDDYAGSAPSIAPFGSETAGALVYSLGWLLVGLLVAHLLYRRRIFIKV